MAITESWFKQDLKKPVVQRYIVGNFFSLDNVGNLVGVKVYDNGTEATLSGSVTGYCALADGTTVPVTGTRSGNQAYILLPQSALSIPGYIGIVLKLTDGNTITTLLSIIATVYPSQTDEVITPSQQVITDWSQQINTALQNVVDASAAQDEKIDDLKSAFGKADNLMLGVIPLEWEQGNINSSGNQNNAKVIRIPGYLDIGTGTVIGYQIADGYTVTIIGYRANNVYAGGLVTLTGSGLYKITTEGIVKIRIKANTNDSVNIVPSEGYANVILWVNDSGGILERANGTAKNDKLSLFWEQGTLTSSGESSSNNLIRSIGYIGTGMIGSVRSVYDTNTYALRLFEYDGDKNYIRVVDVNTDKVAYLHPNTEYIRLRGNLVAGTAILPSEGDAFSLYINSGRPEYVTPQMFGATGDGATDDTAAFQAAVESGYDVCVPFSKHQIYLITSMIRISGPLCKRMFGDGGGNGYILYDVQAGHPESDFADLRSRSLFRIVDTQAFTFDKLNVRAKTATIGGKTKRVGGFLRANDDTCDYDIKIRECNITKFYRFVEFRGRGFTLEDSAVTSMQILGNFTWADTIDTNHNHPANMDQRAIIIKGNRLHSIQGGGFSIRSGHAYGLVFADNVLDVGRKYALIAYEEAWNWTIANNTLLGYVDAMPVFEFKAGAKNLLMIGNQMISDSYFWVSSPGNPTYWLLSGGVITGSCIASNIFKNAKNSLIHVKGLLASTICNNVLTNPGHIIGTNEDSVGSGTADDEDNPYYEEDYITDDVEQDDDESGSGSAEDAVGCIYIEDSVQNSAIIGNIATYTSGGTLLKLGSGATQSNVIIEHNIGA